MLYLWRMVSPLGERVGAEYSGTAPSPPSDLVPSRRAPLAIVTCLFWPGDTGAILGRTPFLLKVLGRRRAQILTVDVIAVRRIVVGVSLEIDVVQHHPEHRRSNVMELVDRHAEGARFGNPDARDQDDAISQRPEHCRIGHDVRGWGI